MTTPRIFFYKMTADNGGAPCLDDGLLSLAICKPRIRVMAQEGSLIFGFAANSLSRDNRLIYAARVTETAGRSYYTEHRFAGRSDRIYRWSNGAFHRRSDARHHPRPQDLRHDLGKRPEYKRACVLLSADFRYLGIKGTAEYKRRYHAIKEAVERLGRGYRSRLDETLREDFFALKDWLWAEFQTEIVGGPTSRPSRKPCHRALSVGEC